MLIQAVKEAKKDDGEEKPVIHIAEIGSHQPLCGKVGVYQLARDEWVTCPGCSAAVKELLEKPIKFYKK